MKIRKETIMNVSAQKVWEILGPRYVEVDKWASSVNIAQGNNKPGVGKISGAPCTGRVCDTELGQFKENVEIYNENKKEIAYSAQGEKMPFFVKRMLNTWKVIPKGNKALVIMELNVDLMFPFNFIMFMPMRMQLGGVLKKANEELKYFVENNETPHPRKQKAAQQFNKSKPQLVS